jgi:homoserine O-acetyltransferase
VLILHGTGGTGAGFLSQTFGGELFGAGQILDATRYFIILPDGIGHGKSTKPSDGLHARFPKYTYDDMVRAQHAMLVDGLKVNHLAWCSARRWGDALLGLGRDVSRLRRRPRPAGQRADADRGRNRIMRRMIMDSITHDPAYKNGEYTEPPHAGMVGAVNLLMMMTSSPIGWHKSAATRDAADAWYEGQLKSRIAANDANDMLYQFNASRDTTRRRTSRRLPRICSPSIRPTMW